MIVHLFILKTLHDHQRYVHFNSANSVTFCHASFSLYDKSPLWLSLYVKPVIIILMFSILKYPVRSPAWIISGLMLRLKVLKRENKEKKTLHFFFSSIKHPSASETQKRNTSSPLAGGWESVERVKYKVLREKCLDSCLRTILSVNTSSREHLEIREGSVCFGRRRNPWLCGETAHTEK